ncbi:DUF3175 domain-containing protein [Pararobbsia alpina]|uniref:DUF3175 domain-containing protein n=1 Tax=Pararobbsia alpina TaxID=621374 RepID=A0A6S7B7E3_9BURK|nr:DUF3175 domain-containing protein [Pararobbsia alpina]CAB3781981.1 hypothetical protein LMG28138_01410 [Pararobbsia alpina]
MAKKATRASSRRHRAAPKHIGRQRHERAQASRKSAPKAAGSPRRWSHEVMEHSDALDLEGGIFKTGSPHEIAESLKRSALASHRRKGSPFQSAMSMLNFYSNRAGRNLPKARRDALQKAKQELRKAFGRDPQPRH